MRGLCLAAVLLLGAFPAPASADLAAQARFHHQRATEHYVAGRYDAALDEFFAVQRIAPSPGTLFNIARCFQRLERDEETFLFYSEYLASGDDDARLRAAAQVALRELTDRVARVRVETDPPGASVFVDQRDRGRYGRSPSVIAVPPGTRQITASLEGYRSVSQEVVAARGEEATVRLTLEQILGQLTVNSPATGAFRLLDENSEVVAEGALGDGISVPPERYVLEVEAEGYRPWRSIVEVVADEASTVAATPEPLPPPSGAITVTANQSGALVRLDDEPVGFAPLALSTVPVGEHRLSVSYDGARPWEGVVEVNMDERAWVTASLAPPASTTRSTASWVLGGTGVAALGVATVFAVLAADRRGQWDRERDAFGDPVTLANLQNQTTTFSTTADALFFAGGLALAVGVLLYFLTEERQDRRSSVAVSREPR